ncbi:hypothetical protein KUTeg_007867 [Tegillarca granosa]|uniref:Calmodulin n=1 Tax=Tegillarca granosa TaxID=220873 RepID=A0ABQ9FIG2_TEGGR|nr:hypothetical protein KUTeg_007867 [Tegillarca granosa]
MPGEPLVCVWEAAYALSSDNYKRLTVSLIKEVTLSFKDLPSVEYSERKFNRLFACSDKVKLVNYKSYVHSVLIASDVRLLQLLPEIENRCWEICRNRYDSTNIPDDVAEMLWRIFNRFADENTFPVLIPAEEMQFLITCLGEKLEIDKKRMINSLGKNTTFATFLNTLNGFVSSPAHIRALRSSVSNIHEKFVKNFIKWGWMHIGTKLMSKFTFWEECWFVLTNERLSYYGKSFLADRSGSSFKGEVIITSETRLEPLPADDFLYKSYSGCFKLSSNQDELEISCGTDIERRFWMELILESIETSSCANNDAISPEKNHIKPFVVEDSNNVSAINKNEKETTESKDVIEIEEEKLKVIFMKLDKDGNGILDKDEFFKFFSLVGMNSMSEEHSNQVFDSIDSDKSGNISFDEFVKYFETAIFQEGEGDSVSNRLRDAFLSADRDGSGTINVKEYIEYMWEQKRGVALSKLMKTFESIQQSGDEEISYEKFQELFKDDPNVLSKTGPSSTNENMNKMLKKLYDDSNSDELAEFLKDRWSSFSSFKRKGASGKVVMSSPDEMVADFTPGSYSLMDLACFSDVPPIEPKHTVVNGVKWISGPEPGKSGKCVFPSDFDGKILCDFGTNETLRYYGCSFANGKQEKISLLYRHGITDFLYANKYLDDYVKLTNGGSGIEKHPFSHLDCPMEDDSGYFILGKFVSADEIHLTAFRIPKLHALYVPGNVIHSNDYLKGKWRTMLSDEANIDHVHLVKQAKDTVNHFTLEFM